MARRRFLLHSGAAGIRRGSYGGSPNRVTPPQPGGRGLLEDDAGSNRRRVLLDIVSVFPLAELAQAERVARVNGDHAPTHVRPRPCVAQGSWERDGAAFVSEFEDRVAKMRNKAYAAGTG